MNGRSSVRDQGLGSDLHVRSKKQKRGVSLFFDLLRDDDDTRRYTEYDSTVIVRLSATREIHVSPDVLSRTSRPTGRIRTIGYFFYFVL